MDIENKPLKETADISAPKSGFREYGNMLASLAAILTVLFAIIWVCTKIAVNYFPDSLEKEIFTNYAPISLGEKKDVKDERFIKAKTIFETLKQKGATRDLKYELCYMDDEMINAFALPGGTICVTKGLLEEVESEKSIAMVLGHEFGHHEKRHVIDRLSTMVTAQILLGVITGYQASSISDNFLNMFMLASSREQELEADAFGANLIEKVYGDVDGAFEFYEKIIEKEGNSKWKSLSTWMQTHPDTKKRLEKLKSQSKEKQ